MEKDSNGVGLGWRPETAWFIQRRRDLVGFTEVIAENADAVRAPLQALVRQGATVIPHGVSLSLGEADPPQPSRIDRLARLAEELRAPFVSEHVAFVRAGGIEAGHLLPVPRTHEMLDVLVDNVRRVTEILPVPLVLENIAALFEWPGNELSEEDFLAELLERSDTLLLLDLANLHAHALNHGRDPLRFLDRLPLDRLAYVHMAGGIERGGLYHDTHAHPLPAGPLALLEALCDQVEVPPPVLLERDRDFAPATELTAELQAIADARSRERLLA